MKNTILILVGIILFSCDNVPKQKEAKDYYSTKVDTTWYPTDRTKIYYISRDIYNKTSENMRRSITLDFQESKIRERQDEFRISKIVLSKNNDPAQSSMFFFDNAELLKEMFAKVDSLESGKKLEERKKTTHYVIDKGTRGVRITQYTSEVSKGMAITLSNEEYQGIKEAFAKYELEKSE
tara:strand:+ start:4034 stop:4573 length:540 start_codon:yes stop_codon:yes gene_type:complete